MRTSFAVFASGRGSNFDAICRAIREERLVHDLRVLLTDQTDAGVIERAHFWQVPVEVVPVKTVPGDSLLERRQRHEREILLRLKSYSPSWVVLAGYKRVLTSELIEAFRSGSGWTRLVNIHPSLLPAFPGLNSYRQAFDYGCKVAGVTVHLVEEAVDGGPICAQQSFSIEGCQTPEDVEKMGLAIEHQILPDALNWLFAEQFDFKKSPGSDGTDSLGSRWILNQWMLKRS